MMLHMLAFISRGNQARVGPGETMSTTPMRSLRMRLFHADARMPRDDSVRAIGHQRRCRNSMVWTTHFNALVAWSCRQPPVEKTEDTIPVNVAALGADVGMIGARNDGALARLIAAGVKALEVFGRRVRIVGPGDEQYRRRRQLANVIHRRELGQAQPETP